MITMKPTGNTIIGHVLDCSQKPFLEALKLYDPLLYFKWNPKKCAGYGCWEIRRKPEEKTAKTSRSIETPRGKVTTQGDVYEFDGYTITWPKYHEVNLTHHILDLAYLNYNAIEKLKKMDMWEQRDVGYKGKNLTSVLDYNEAKNLERIDEKAASEKAYGLKQIRKEIRYYKDLINSGGNPALLADYWK